MRLDILQIRLCKRIPRQRGRIFIKKNKTIVTIQDILHHIARHEDQMTDRVIRELYRVRELGQEPSCIVIGKKYIDLYKERLAGRNTEPFGGEMKTWAGFPVIVCDQVDVYFTIGIKEKE